MRFMLKWLFVLFVLFTLGSCGGIEKKAFNKSANQDIKTIGVLEPANLGEYRVVNFDHPGLAFGIVGGLLAASDMKSKSSQFTEQIKLRNFSLYEDLQNALMTELQRVGYAIKLIKVD
ncbi:MAG: hypothetical protein LLF28_05860 [Nitrospiraceae bacterium]|nr:hypothetical protein [Nitrospiraceae bacterium]